MKPLRIALTATLAFTIFAPPASAIGLGDDAPPLQVKKWLKGGPIDLKDGRGKNVYVIEFWATWCGPCLQGVSRMSKLQEKYKDKGLVVVSISSSDADLKTVTSFVDGMGSRMGYVVAYEDQSAAKTGKAYMDAFNRKGIPHCFVVDKKGKIVWEGHPMFGLDEVLETVFSGKYDVKKLGEIGEKATQEMMQKLQAQQQMIEKYFKLVYFSKKPEEARELGQKVFKSLEGDAFGLNAFAWGILTNEGIQARDLDLALRAAKAAYDACAGIDPAILDTYARALFDTGKVAQAAEYQKQAVKLAAGNERMRKELEETLKRYEKIR